MGYLYTHPSYRSRCLDGLFGEEERQKLIAWDAAPSRRPVDWVHVITMAAFVGVGVPFVVVLLLFWAHLFMVLLSFFR